MNYERMQEQLRWELTGSEVNLSKGTLVGRINVEIEADMLTAFLEKVEQQKGGASYLQRKDQLEKEIGELKAQLAQPRGPTFSDVVKGLKVTTTLNPEKEKMEISGLKALLAQTKQDNLKEVEGLKSQQETLNETLRKVQTSLEEQTSSSADLQAQLERIKVLNEGLDKDLQRERASYQAQLEEQKEEISGLKALLAQTKHENLKEVEGLICQQETLNETLTKVQTSLEEQTSCSADLQAQLERIEALNKGLEKDLQRERASCEAQLEEQKIEMDAVKAALEKAELQFNTSWVDWKEESLSLKKDREEMRQTLKKKQQETDTNQSQWMEEKSSLHRETDALKTTLLQKEQQWEQKEKAFTSQLEELEAQIQKKNKKKKKKWFRRLFSYCQI